MYARWIGAWWGRCSRFIFAVSVAPLGVVALTGAVGIAIDCIFGVDYFDLRTTVDTLYHPLGALRRDW